MLSKLVKTPGKTQKPSLNKAILAIAVASFAIGTVVRVLAAQNDLWFDEVWTLELLRERVHSFGDVFINIKHSNNHHLCFVVDVARWPKRLRTNVSRALQCWPQSERLCWRDLSVHADPGLRDASP